MTCYNYAAIKNEYENHTDIRRAIEVGKRKKRVSKIFVTSCAKRKINRLLRIEEIQCVPRFIEDVHLTIRSPQTQMIFLIIK
jgi:hypothetical protein